MDTFLTMKDMIKIPFNKNTPFLILEQENLHIIGNKIFHINKGYNIIHNDEILEYFLNHPEVFKNIPKKPTEKHVFELFPWYSVFENKIIYHNILFLLLDKSNYKNFENIFCLHNNKIYNFEIKDLQKNFWFLFSNLSQPLYELMKRLENKEVKIYYNVQVYNKIEEKILKKIQDNKIIEVSLEQRLTRFSWLKENFLLTNENLHNSQTKTIKIKTEINLPVIHLQKIPSKSKIHKYFSAYNFTYPEHYKIIKNRWGSGGSDLYDKKSARIKAFAEAIERHHSSYLDEDILKNFQKFDYQQINNIIGANIYNQKHKSICKKSFEIFSERENIKIGNVLHIPNEIIFYPYIDNNLYFANSNWIGAGRSYEEALLSWLFELSERDSLMLMWLQKLTPKKD